MPRSFFSQLLVCRPPCRHGVLTPAAVLSTGVFGMRAALQLPLWVVIHLRSAGLVTVNNAVVAVFASLEVVFGITNCSV